MEIDINQVGGCRESITTEMHDGVSKGNADQFGALSKGLFADADNGQAFHCVRNGYG